MILLIILIGYAESNGRGPQGFSGAPILPNFHFAAKRVQFLTGSLQLGQHHIAQHGDVCIGFPLQTPGLCGGVQLFVVFKLCFLNASA